MSTTVSFVDRETSSPAFVVIRRLDEAVAMGFGVEKDGDLDLVVADDDARRIAEAILGAIDRS